MIRRIGTMVAAVSALLGTFTATCARADDSGPRYLFVMIADGAGYNTWQASAMFEGRLGRSFYDTGDWVRVSVATYALRNDTEIPRGKKALRQDKSLIYDPKKAWDRRKKEGRVKGYAVGCRGYEWLRKAPDSANTATALATGTRTYRGAINMDGAGQPIERTLARIAHDRGLGVGIVSSVPFCHATPAAFGGAHRRSRSDYPEIALDLLTSGECDVIVGTGNPDFDHRGQPSTERDALSYRFVGGKKVWQHLTGEAWARAAEPTFEGRDSSRVFTQAEIDELNEWKLVQSESAIESLLTGETPEKLVVVPEIGETILFAGSTDNQGHPSMARLGATLQQDRPSLTDPQYAPPGSDPKIPGVPSLATLTRVALRTLDRATHRGGFVLHVEGGAVDWAMHANQMGRMIEEMIDFERSVEAVEAWITKNVGWDDALLIVTADHDHLLWGPNSNDTPFDPIQDRGKGKLPGYRWLFDHHSNALVPLFARGRGASQLVQLATKQDPVYGAYLEQPQIFDVMAAFVEGGADVLGH